MLRNPKWKFDHEILSDLLKGNWKILSLITNSFFFFLCFFFLFAQYQISVFSIGKLNLLVLFLLLSSENVS
jgi:hypothetical protein